MSGIEYHETLIAGAGFSGISVAHNAAHDVRHANNFPCH